MRLIDADALIRMLKSPNTFWNHYKETRARVDKDIRIAEEKPEGGV